MKDKKDKRTTGSTKRLAVRIGNAAEQLDCSEASIRRLMALGKLEVTKVLGDKRIVQESIDRLVHGAK